MHSFLRMLGSLDSMHCKSINCLNAYHAQYTQGNQGYLSVYLALYSLIGCIDLSCYFDSTPDSLNDIKVLITLRYPTRYVTILHSIILQLYK